jgi:hypothetical protein
MATTSCVTKPRVRSDPQAVGPRVEGAAPFVYRGDYPDRLGIIMHDVLATHGFTHPWIVVGGVNSSVWFVAERWESESRFDRLFVCVTSERSASATIAPYFRAPSNWALLGRLFADPQPEANAIAAAVTQKWKSEMKP